MPVTYLTTADIHRETGISVPTIRKYRRQEEKEGGRLWRFSSVINGKRWLRDDCLAELFAMRQEALTKRGRK